MTQQQILMRTGAQRSPEGQYSPPGLDPLGGQLISGLLPPYAKLAHLGMLYAIDMSGGTAIAPKTGSPRTKNPNAMA